MAEDGELREGEGSIIHTATIPAASSSTETGNETLTVDISSFTHTPFYCEENVYLLCKKLSFRGVADQKGFDLFVIFISNEKKQVPLWCQKASKRTDGLVLWDYHVICIQSKRNGEGDGSHLVWDLDSSLPFPFSLDQYMTEAIRPSLPFYPGYSRLFRVIHAPVFLRCFASDRRHMKDHLGNWISPPPTYEPFVAEDGTVNNLDEYIRMSAADVMRNTEENLVRGVFSSTLGVVVGETQLEELFSQMCKS